MNTKHIIFQFAMDFEANPFIHQMGLIEIDTPSPLAMLRGTKVYQKETNEGIITAIITGKDENFNVQRVGTANAAQLATMIALTYPNLSLLINAGTAGYLLYPEEIDTNDLSDKTPMLEIPSIYFSNGEFYFTDHRIKLGPYEKYGNGPFNGIALTDIANKLNCPLAAISTGDSLDVAEVDLTVLQANQSRILDMEATAIAQALSNLTSPAGSSFTERFTSIKVIANCNGINLGRRPHEEFEKNFDCANQLLANTLSQVCDHLLVPQINLIEKKEINPNEVLGGSIFPSPKEISDNKTSLPNSKSPTNS